MSTSTKKLTLLLLIPLLGANSCTKRSYMPHKERKQKDQSKTETNQVIASQKSTTDLEEPPVKTPKEDTQPVAKPSTDTPTQKQAAKNLLPSNIAKNQKDNAKKVIHNIEDKGIDGDIKHKDIGIKHKDKRKDNSTLPTEKPKKTEDEKSLMHKPSRFNKALKKIKNKITNFLQIKPH